MHLCKCILAQLWCKISILRPFLLQFRLCLLSNLTCNLFRKWSFLLFKFWKFLLKLAGGIARPEKSSWFHLIYVLKWRTKGSLARMMSEEWFLNKTEIVREFGYVCFWSFRGKSLAKSAFFNCCWVCRGSVTGFINCFVFLILDFE